MQRNDSGLVSEVLLEFQHVVQMIVFQVLMKYSCVKKDKAKSSLCALNPGLADISWFRKNRLLLVFLLTFGMHQSVFAEDNQDIAIPADLGSYSGKKAFSFVLGGYFRNETAYRFDEPRSFTKIRNTASLNAKLDLGSWARFYASGRAYYDSVYDFVNFETIASRVKRDELEPLVFVEQLPEEKDQERQELREAYLDLYLDNFDFRVGKQFIIWGVLEGLRIVDEINPMDFRELILPELLDYRIPLWSLKANYYGTNTNYELIWIPELKLHQPAPRGSEWELFQILDATSTPVNYDPYYSEAGFKITRDIYNTEVSLSFFYTWDDYPSTFRIISREEVSNPTPTENLAILPTYARMAMYGSTFTREIAGNILKGEFAYVSGKYFAIEDLYVDGFLFSDGEVSRDHIRWGLGYDFSFAGADISPAIAQWVILGYDDIILMDRFDTTFNLFVRKPLQKQSAVFSLLFIYLINFDEVYAKPKFTFNLTSRFQVSTGLDLFMGERSQFGRAFDPNDPGGLVDVRQQAQFLGNFKDNRRMFVELKYSF